MRLMWLLVHITYLLAFGRLFGQDRTYTTSLNTFNIEQSIDLASRKEREGDRKEATRFLNHAATLAWEARDYPMAIRYFERSIALNESIGNHIGITSIHSNLGMIYADLRDYTKALEYFELAIAGRQAAGDKMNQVQAYINASTVLNNLKRYSDAAQYLQFALAIAKEIRDIDLMRSCYGMLAETYDKAGNPKEMLRYYEYYKTFVEKNALEIRRKATLEKEKANIDREKAELAARSIAAEKKLAELQLTLREKELLGKDLALRTSAIAIDTLTKRLTREELERQNAKLREIAAKRQYEILKLKANEEQARYELQAERQQRLSYLLATGLVALVIVLGILSLRYYEKRRNNRLLIAKNLEITRQKTEIETKNAALEQANHEISEKNKSITESIIYAAHIQRAMLPTSDDIAVGFPEHFIYWKPRDIVSGDFYWYAHVPHPTVPHAHKHIITVADCTGHGVPGAFVSILGDSLLNHSVHEKGIHRADEILNLLHLGVMKTLNQQQTKNRDGMDIALIVVDPIAKTMEYAGANNPLLYVQNDTLHEIKADKVGIGGLLYHHEQHSPRTFTRHTISIEQPTWVYMFSDGFQDQFGGVDNRKFMYRQLKVMLGNLVHYPADQQRQVVDKIFSDWVRGVRQIDDVLVMGVKVS